MAEITQARGRAHEPREIVVASGEQGLDLIEGERLAGVGPGQRPAKVSARRLRRGAGRLGHEREPTTLYRL